MRRNRIYFDNAAAAMPDAKTLAEQYVFASRFYANQEAGHSLGYELRKHLEKAEIRISRALCGEGTFVHWGESGTDIIRLFSDFPVFRKGNIVTTPLEHSALKAALGCCGAEVRAVKLDKGHVDLQHLRKLLDKDTVLCAINHVQSETGIIQDLTAIGKVVKEYAPQAVFMSDTIQSAGKISIPWKEAQLDIITVSGHKTGAAGGAALLFRKDNAVMKEFNDYLQHCRKDYFTASRPQIPAAKALANGIERSCEKQLENIEKIQKINSFLRLKLPELKLFNGKKITFTVAADQTSPYILHFIVPGYQSAVLVRILSQENIYFSAGSACQAESGGPSEILTAMGFPAEDAYAGIRLSFSTQNTVREAEIFIEKFQNALSNY